jgi:hypothetical protein
VAVNVAVVAAAGTVTDEGTVTAELVDDRTTLDPLAGAGAEIVTVQMEFAPEATVAGEQFRLDTVAAVMVNVAAAVVPFSEAVRETA